MTAGCGPRRCARRTDPRRSRPQAPAASVIRRVNHDQCPDSQRLPAGSNHHCVRQRTTVAHATAGAASASYDLRWLKRGRRGLHPLGALDEELTPGASRLRPAQILRAPKRVPIGRGTASRYVRWRARISRAQNDAGPSGRDRTYWRVVLAAGLLVAQVRLADADHFGVKVMPLRYAGTCSTTTARSNAATSADGSPRTSNSSSVAATRPNS